MQHLFFLVLLLTDCKNAEQLIIMYHATSIFFALLNHICSSSFYILCECAWDKLVIVQNLDACPFMFAICPSLVNVSAEFTNFSFLYH